MPSINSQPVLPGVFTQVQQNLLPAVTGGIRVAAFIGTGRLTNLVVNESVTRGSGNLDALVHTSVAFDGTTIQDANFVVYDSGEDYRLSGTFNIVSVTDGTHLVVDNTTGLSPTDTITQGASSTTITTVTDSTHLVVGSTVGFVAGAAKDTTATQGEVLWLTSAASITGTTSAPYADQNGKTFSFKVGSNAITVVTFSGATTSVASVVSQINSAYGDTIASANGSSLELSTGTLSVPVLFNTSITIENGTSNSALGFTAGSLVSSPSRPALGVIYFVSYEWAKQTSDYNPAFYFTSNFTSITNAVGSVGGGNDGQTANIGGATGAWSLPVAAQLAQQNGASIICLVQMNPADGANASQVRSALTKLLATAGVNIVVSLDGADNAMLIPDLTAHVETASSTINRLERTTFIGFAGNPSDATMLGYATAASSNRVVVVNATNTTNSMFIGTAQTATVVDGTLLAVALAGVRTNPAFDVAQPLTREILSGIATTNTLTQGEKTFFVNNGVLVVDNISGTPKVVFGTTTEFDTVLNQLYQVTEITDYCAQTLRGLLDPIFIGQKLLLDTPSQVQTVTAAILQTIQSDAIINGFTSPATTVSGTTIFLTVGIIPTLETDVILITLGLNLQ